MQDGDQLGDLAERFGLRVVGDATLRVTGVAPLETAGPDQISFYTNMRYREAFESTQAGAVVVKEGQRGPTGQSLLVAEEPYFSWSQLVSYYHPTQRPAQGIHPSAVVAPSAQIDPSCSIGPLAIVGEGVALAAGVVVGAHCVLGDRTQVGEGSLLYPHVTTYRDTRIGARCTLHAGVVLGADGFGFATVEGEHHKVPQIGHVVLEDDVEIGANSCVDRGAMEPTTIGRGTKIDDLVMVAHGVKIGAGSLLAAQSGVAGSTQLGRHNVFAGQSGAAGHLKLADGTIVTAKSAVFADTERGGMISGVPADDHRNWLRAQALARKLPELNREVKRLQRRLAVLEQTLAGKD